MTRTGMTLNRRLWGAPLLSASLALLAWLASSAPLRAQLHIEITSGVQRPVPIAIVPFGWQGTGADAPFDLAGLVAADLHDSGRFAPLPDSDMITRPTQPLKVNFRNWRAVKVDDLLIGRLRQDGPDQFTIEYNLFDVLRGEQLLGFRLTSSRENLRAAGHRISDMVYHELTGIKGVFSTRIAYVTENRAADPGKRYRLIVADADGANARVVTASSQPLMSPAWSPDGRRLAYVSFEGNHSAVYIQTLSTGTRERVSNRPGVNSAPAFSPDGRQLALTLSTDNGNLDVYTMDLATRKLRRITKNPAIDTAPAWGPQGKVLYFTSDRSGGPQIFRVALSDGGRPERITFDGNYNARPRVSPDGKSLAVVHQERSDYRIALIDIKTGLTQVLSHGELDEAPSFAPNGAKIIYATRAKNGQGVLASVSTDGRIRQQIASVAGDVREPVWSPFPLP